MSKGSSPRVRGTEHFFPLSWVPFGIIPACAGNSSEQHISILTSWDHPRVCGEQRFPELQFPELQGSSPRVRGTGFDALIIAEWLGIIPACAGNR